MRARGGRTIAAVIAGIALAGCHFAVVPPKGHGTPRPTQAGNPAVQRLADAPALLVQCAIDRVGLRPASRQDWVQDRRVQITPANAADFETWWHGHDTLGPYGQTFVIDGHRTHYLAFGATWVLRGGQWTPEHSAQADPVAKQDSLYGWANWAAVNDKLPPAVCGTSVTARRLQDEVYARALDAGNPWAA
jgi:hypothetical protein